MIDRETKNLGLLLGRREMIRYSIHKRNYL